MSVNYWFEEKRAQCSESSMTAFGIQIQSRHAKAYELIEMLTFAKECAAAGLESFVRPVFYDSKACICTVEVIDDAPADVGQRVMQIANACITQVDWYGDVLHRDGCEFERTMQYHDNVVKFEPRPQP